MKAKPTFSSARSQERDAKAKWILAGWTWGGFNTFGDKQLTAMFEKVQAFALEMLLWPLTPSPQGRWLSLVGASDNGKTHLARSLVALFHQYCEHYQHPVLDTVQVRPYRQHVFPQLMVALRDDPKRTGHVTQAVWDADLYFLDDLGADQDTQFSANTAYNLLAGRENKPTIITSNLMLQEIAERLDIRLASRLERCGEVVQVDTEMFHHRKQRRGDS
jgi:DNA replication protein DnaC